MSIHLKGVIPVPGGSCYPEQPAEKLTKGDTPTQLRATYLVRHSDEAFPTYIYNDLVLDVQVPGRIREPLCRATMLIETPWLPTAQDAIDKMAAWLERLAIAMREGTVQPGFQLEAVAAPLARRPRRRCHRHPDCDAAEAEAAAKAPLSRDLLHHCNEEQCDCPGRDSDG